MSKNRRGVPRRRKKKKKETSAPRLGSRYSEERRAYEFRVLIDPVEDKTTTVDALLDTYALREPREAALAEVMSDAHRAQLLAYDAMSADRREGAVRFAREALALDPQNIDARVLLLEELNDDEDFERGLREILTSAETQLGADFIQENRGKFWGLIETRPYMRVLACLGLFLKENQRFDEAANVFVRMLDLNRDDHQGARIEAVIMLMAAGRFFEVEPILDVFNDGDDEVLLLAEALLGIIANDAAETDWALSSLFRLNPYLIDFFTGFSIPYNYSHSQDCDPGTPGAAIWVIQRFFPVLGPRPDLLVGLARATKRIADRVAEYREDM